MKIKAHFLRHSETGSVSGIAPANHALARLPTTTAAHMYNNFLSQRLHYLVGYSRTKSPAGFHFDHKHEHQTAHEEEFE